MVAYAFYKVIYISRRWRDLAEMLRNISASALNSFCVYFFQTMRPVFACRCRYRRWPHGQPAGLIRLTGHLMLLAFFSCPPTLPRDMRGQGIWATLFDWCRDYFSEKEEWSKSVSEGFLNFFFSFSKPDDTCVSQFGFIPW